MLTGATMLCVGQGMTSSVNDAEREEPYELRSPSITRKNVVLRHISPTFDEAALNQISPYVSGGLESYPDLYHQGLTRALQQGIKNQYQKIHELKEDEKAIKGGKNLRQQKEQEILTLRENINQKEENVKIHCNLLNDHKAIRHDEGALKASLKATIQGYKSDLRQGSTSQSPAAINMAIKDAEAQLEILSIPLSQREVELQLLKSTLIKMTEELEFADQHPLNLQDIQGRIKQEEGLLNDLTHLRARTVYLEPSFLQAKNHYLFAPQDVKRALKRFLLPNMVSSIEALEDQKAWRYFAQSLELADPKLPSTSSGSLLDAYRSHIAELGSTFTERLKEDAFYLQMMMGLLATYNEKALIDKRPLLQINTQDFDKREENVVKSLKKRDHFIDSGLLTDSLRNLKHLLQEAGIEVDDESFAPVMKNGFIGRLMGSLERGAHYSWHSNGSLLARVHQKLSKGKDITPEVMLSLYSFLGRTINKAVLEVMLEDIQPSTPIIMPVEEAEEEDFVPLNLS